MHDAVKPSSSAWLAVRRTCLLVALAFIGCLAQETAAAVYHWQPETFTAAVGGPFMVTPQTRADGTTRPLINATGGGWNVFISVDGGVLQGGNEYTATLSYEVVKSPQFPGTFHMFARSKKLGIQRDAWLNWLGEPGDHGTARLPMRLPPADDWTFSVGCKGPAALIVEAFDITAGTGFVFMPAVSEPAVVSPTAAPAAVESPAHGCSAVVLEPPVAGTGIEVSVIEFGMVADTTAVVTPEVAASNALALQRALRACSTRNASRLVIPAGVYRLNPKDPIGISDQHDLVIDGQGAELIFTKLMRNVAVLNLNACKRVEIRNLNLDWDATSAPIASTAVVESLAADGKSCVMRFPDLDAAAVERVKTAAWSHMWHVDAQTLQSISDGRFTFTVDKRETVGGNGLAVTFTTPQALVVGNAYVIRHLYYEMGAFKLSDCSHVLFDHVNIYAMPGMGWIGRGDLDHLALKHCRITRRPGSRLPLTTAADGFHILDSHGGILIEDSEIIGTGDDCINIHDNCCQGVRKTSPTTLVLVDNPKYRMRVAEGDRLELFRSDYSPLGVSGIAKQVTFVKNDTVIEFTAPLPEVVSPLSIVFNRRYGTCDVRLARNHFDHGRVLLSAQRVTVEDCDFDHPLANAIQLHTEIVSTLWSEGCGAGDVVIRRNVFRGANQCQKFNGAVIHGAPVLPAGRTQYPLFRNILINDNRFIDSYGPAVYLVACQGVEVRGNRIESAQMVAGSNAQAGSIIVDCSSDLQLGGNTWIAGAGQRLPGVLYDPLTTKNVHAEGNRLIAATQP